MIAEALLSRLDKVKRTGDGRWVACCPVHEDKTPSLVITEKDDRVLIHCFAGCPVDHVVGAVGLDLSDLFPPRSNSDRHGAHAGKQRRQHFQARDVLTCVGSEAMFVALCASHMARGERLTTADHDRLMLAASRLNEAKGLAGL